MSVDHSMGGRHEIIHGWEMIHSGELRKLVFYIGSVVKRSDNQNIRPDDCVVRSRLIKICLPHSIRKKDRNPFGTGGR